MFGTATAKGAPAAPSAYGRSFYEEIGSGSEASAERLLPVVLDLVHPGSAVDLGCGDGSWLAVLQRLGVTDVIGVDGPWALSGLKIARDRFIGSDLVEPVDLGRRFDLAMSLEVAEHLPAHAGRRLVERLTDLAPAVLFSAAVPGQGGTGHVNEQWPDYWVDLFGRRGFAMADVFRARLWDDPVVEPWYLQNAFLFVSDDARAASPRLAEAAGSGPQLPLRVVHPRMFELHDAAALPLGVHLRNLPQALGTSLRRCTSRIRWREPAAEPRR